MRTHWGGMYRLDGGEHRSQVSKRWVVWNVTDGGRDIFDGGQALGFQYMERSGRADRDLCSPLSRGRSSQLTRRMMGFQQPVGLIGVCDNLASCHRIWMCLPGIFSTRWWPRESLHVEFSRRRHGLLAALAVERGDVSSVYPHQGKILGRGKAGKESHIFFSHLKQPVRSG